MLTKIKFSILLLMLFFAGCETYQPQPVTPSTRAAFDPTDFAGGQIFEIIPQQSEVRILVYRSGTLAKLGHNHVVSSNTIHGKIYQHAELDKAGLHLDLPIAAFIVDNPELRHAEGDAFSSQPSAKDIEGTRKNMLSEKVLNAINFPNVTLRSVNIEGRQHQLSVLTRITIQNNDYDIAVPVNVHYENNKLFAQGSINLKQTDIGLTPFSILMGAIAVQDELVIKFNFTAQAI